MIADAGAAAAWFAPAIAAALVPIYLAIARAQNSSAEEPHHSIAAPPGSAVTGFPSTVERLANLSARNAAGLEAAYNIQVAANATLRQRRQAIASYLGVRVTV